MEISPDAWLHPFEKLSYILEGKMSEIEQLKERIRKSCISGIETAHIRDDYEPAGAMMIRTLTDSGEYVQRKTPAGNYDQKWRIFKKDFAPY